MFTYASILTGSHPATPKNLYSLPIPHSTFNNLLTFIAEFLFTFMVAIFPCFATDSQHLHPVFP